MLRTIGVADHFPEPGGPILRNDIQVLVILPINPHTLTHRPVVDSADRTIELAPGLKRIAAVGEEVRLRLQPDRLDGIARLNKRYGPASGGGSRFVLFHRRRVWNRSEHTWMGWERKRGKLHELNQLLRGSTHTTFMSVGGQPPESIPAEYPDCLGHTGNGAAVGELHLHFPMMQPGFRGRHAFQE